MKAMIFAAGLGTRLKPLTDTMPKALVPIGGRPMLEHVILKLKEAGFTELVINIHHFGEQIIDFLHAQQHYGLTIQVSDERGRLLDTGGGIKKAQTYLNHSDEPFLIHNVDILSNVDLKALYEGHLRSRCDGTLLVSQRQTARYLLFDREESRLHGWINKETGVVKPVGFVYDEDLYDPYAFSGIHVLSPSVFPLMNSYETDSFPIMDFYLHTCHQIRLKGCFKNDLKLMDIGKFDSLERAERFFEELQTMKEI